MTEQEARNKSEEARAASTLVNLWLEHPWVAHDLHERAASAYDQLIDRPDTAMRFKRLAAEHRAAAQHYARLEMNWNKLMGYDQRDCSSTSHEQPFDVTKHALQQIGTISGIPAHDTGD